MSSGRLGLVMVFAVMVAGGGLAFGGAPALAVTQSCPNEGVRVEQELRLEEALRAEAFTGDLDRELPDCRAYEMVTPPYTGGDSVFVMAISEDGQRVLGTSLGAFAGTENDEVETLNIAAMYEFTRTGSGWVTEPLAPSPSVFSPTDDLGNSLLAVSPELTSTLWSLHNAGSRYVNEVGLYLRTSTGTFIPVGPLQSTQGEDPAQPYFVGASRSLEHVFFSGLSNSGGAFLWPGDTTAPSSQTETGNPSLYEYSGSENSEPVLVGVRNVGPLHGSPHVNEGAELISRCGTELGSKASGYNDVSASGAVALFTALGAETENDRCLAAGAPEVDELYARVDGSQTIAISEPALQNCEACQTTSGLANAYFQGASEDGSRVFFTTSQSLLPGASGNELFEYELSPQEPSSCPARPDGCLTLVSAGGSAAEVKGVARISEDGSRVYYIAGGVLTGANAEGRAPVEKADNLYCYDSVTGATSFIGTLSAHDKQVWNEHDLERPAESTPDGEYFLFTSSADLTPGDTSTVSQVFEYDADTEQLRRISIGQNGYAENGNTTNPSDAASLGFEQQSFLGGFRGAGINTTRTQAARALADGGERVFFDSALALTPQVGAGVPNNVYEWEREGAGSCPVGEVEGCVYLVSDGRDRSTTNDGLPSVELVGADVSGEDVLFTSADRLLSVDSDTQTNLFDARVGGGFPEPSAQAECAGSECQSPLELAPAAASVATAAAQGEASVGVLGVIAASPAESGNATSKPRALSAAQKLARALRSCRVERALARRRACEKGARRTYRVSTHSASEHGKGRR